MRESRLLGTSSVVAQSGRSECGGGGHENVWDGKKTKENQRSAGYSSIRGRIIWALRAGERDHVQQQNVQRIVQQTQCAYLRAIDCLG